MNEHFLWKSKVWRKKLVLQFDLLAHYLENGRTLEQYRSKTCWNTRAVAVIWHAGSCEAFGKPPCSYLYWYLSVWRQCNSVYMHAKRRHFQVWNWNLWFFRQQAHYIELQLALQTSHARCQSLKGHKCWKHFHIHWSGRPIFRNDIGQHRKNVSRLVLALNTWLNDSPARETFSSLCPIPTWTPLISPMSHKAKGSLTWNSYLLECATNQRHLLLDLPESTMHNSHFYHVLREKKFTSLRAWNNVSIWH